MSVWALVIVEAMALWLGYQVGLEKGVEKERTKRGVRRG